MKRNAEIYPETNKCPNGVSDVVPHTTRNEQFYIGQKITVLSDIDVANGRIQVPLTMSNFCLSNKRF